MKTRKIILYNEPEVLEIQLERLKKFLRETFSVEIEIRKSIFQCINKDMSENIASCRVFNLKNHLKNMILQKKTYR